MSERLGLTPDDVALPTAGLHTISGIGNLVSALAGGGSCLVASKVDAGAWRRWLHRWAAHLDDHDPNRAQPCARRDRYDR